MAPGGSTAEIQSGDLGESDVDSVGPDDDDGVCEATVAEIARYLSSPEASVGGIVEILDSGTSNTTNSTERTEEERDEGDAA